MADSAGKAVSRRRFIGTAATGAAAAAIFGVGGYYAGLSTRGPGQVSTVTATQTQTQATTITQTATATVTRTVTGTQEPPISSKIVVLAWNNEIIGLDPHTGQGSDVQDSPREAMFEHFINPIRPVGYGPGVLIKYAYTDAAKLTLEAEVRPGVKFHNGDEVTAEDIQFSIQRMAQPGMFVPFVWANVTSFDPVDRYNLRMHFDHYDPTFIGWMGFLEAYVIPKNYFQQVGEENFLKTPVGCGPFKFKSFEAGTLELEAFRDYWQGPPAIGGVVFKPVLDPAARAAEVEAGGSDFTLQVDISDYQRLKDAPNLAGMAPFIADVAVLYVAPYFEPFKDERVRVACHHAVDKQSLVRDVLLGTARPLSTTAAPEYAHYDPTYAFPYDPAKAQSLLTEAGYGPSSPLQLTIQTTKGWVSKDFEVVQAIADMWRAVGIQVEIENLAGPFQLFDKRDHGQLTAFALYVWSNSTGDPANSIGYEMWSESPFSAWSGLKFASLTDHTGLMAQTDERVAPLFFEADERKRIELGREAEKWVVERGLILPLYQMAQTLVMNRKLQYEPWIQGGIKPYTMRWTE